MTFEGDRRLGALRQMVDVLASPADPADTINAWAHVVATRFADVACVHLVDPSAREGVRVIAEARRNGRPDGFAADSPALLTAVHDVLVSRRRRRVSGPESAALVVPVTVGGEVRGTASFVSLEEARWHDREEREVAEVLAALLGQPLVGLASAVVDDVPEPERAVDRQPETPGLEVAARASPPDRASRLWVDTIPLAGYRTALVAGEVSVKGPHGVELADRMRHSVRALAAIDLPPDVLLRHLSDLVRGFDPGIVVSCVYAVHDAAAQCLSLANAGHAPPLVTGPLHDGGYVPVASGIGAPLGVGSRGVRTIDLELPAGSVIAFPTGSLVESDRLAALGERLALLDGTEHLGPAVHAILDPAHGSADAAGAPSAVLVARTVDASLRHRELVLPGEPAAASTARQFVRGLSAEWGLAAHTDTIDLLVTELVTNAIRHARPPIALRAIRGADGFVCEVSDGSMRAPVPRVAGWEEEQGRGLVLTAQLAERWGYRQVADGKAVWFEIDAT
jgi:anti-sigma regulatory factor (Ser/Thr protein kinase)